jgi:hypothetical protein
MRLIGGIGRSASITDGTVSGSMNMAKSRITWLTFAAAVLIVIWAASPQSAPTPVPVAHAVAKPAAPPAYALRLTPAEFFTGELKRLKQHVDFQAVSFKIAKQDHVRCWPDIQMWCDGKRRDSGKYAYQVDWHSDEVSLSWRRKEVGRRVEYDIRLGGLVTCQRVLEEPSSKQKIEVEFGPVMIRKPVTLNAVGDSAVVWVMGTGYGADPAKPEQFKKMVRTAPWVLFVGFEAR